MFVVIDRIWGSWYMIQFNYCLIRFLLLNVTKILQLYILISYYIIHGTYGCVSWFLGILGTFLKNYGNGNSYRFLAIKHYYKKL